MEISENEKAAFFAGIIEGEGTISIVKWTDRRTPRRTSVTLSPRIVIGNNDLRLIGVKRK